MLLTLSALMAACGQATARQGAGPTPTATPTPTSTIIPTPTVPPASSLTWQSHTLPASPTGAPAAALAISQSDGNTAYVCAADTTAPHNRARVWVTHDQAGQWSRVTDIQISPDEIAPGGAVSRCVLTVDALRPATLVARVTVSYPGQSCRGGCASISTFASTDGGRTWVSFDGPLPEIAALATYQRMTYATFHRIPHGFDGGNILAISRDGLRTWSKISPPLTIQTGLPEWIDQFWLNPLDGGLLVLTSTGAVGSGRLWRSADGGQTWTPLAPPPFPFDPSYIVAQQPYTKQDWVICGAAPVLGTMPSPPNHPNEIACTRDGGATWARRALDIPAGYTIFPILGLADDGSLLLNVTQSDAPVISPVLYRVPFGASTITSLGTAPYVGTAFYTAGQGRGVLWMGPIDQQTDLDPQGRIFTAAYP